MGRRCVDVRQNGDEPKVKAASERGRANEVSLTTERPIWWPSLATSPHHGEERAERDAETYCSKQASFPIWLQYVWPHIAEKSFQMTYISFVSEADALVE